MLNLSNGIFDNNNNNVNNKDKNVYSFNSNKMNNKSNKFYSSFHFMCLVVYIISLFFITLTVRRQYNVLTIFLLYIF